MASGQLVIPGFSRKEPMGIGSWEGRCLAVNPKGVAVSISVIDEVRIRIWKDRTRFCTNLGVCKRCFALLDRDLTEYLADTSWEIAGKRDCELIVTCRRRLFLWEIEDVADLINDRLAVCHVDRHLE